MMKFSGEMQAFKCSSVNPSRTTILCRFLALIKHLLIAISPALASSSLLSHLLQRHSSLHQASSEEGLRFSITKGSLFTGTAVFSLQKLQILCTCLALRRSEL